MLSKKRSKFLFIFFSFFTILTRFIGIFWGEGYFFHPDENNMGLSITNMSSDLNPHFFAYGQFPLYLVYFIIKILNLPQNLPTSIYSLRIFSAIFSVISIYIFFKISQFFFKARQSLLFILLIVFCPGLIQLAHFGTTESLLILVFSSQIYLALKYCQKPNKSLYFLSILVSAIGVASKISSLLLISPFLLSILFTSKKIHTFLVRLFIYIFLSVFVSIVLSPYSLIAWPDFLSAQVYETSVATGRLKVFYTRQFDNTLPYIFQFTKIFPYVVGLPVFLLSIPIIINIKKYTTPKNRQDYLIILLPSLVYFLYFGCLYVKWTRFMSPLFFLFPFFAVHALKKIKPRLQNIFIFISILPGIFLTSNYFKNDIRMSFTQWFSSNITPDSNILSEAGNVVNIPLVSDYKISNFDFYNLDSDPSLQSLLSTKVSETDYIIIPSRRIFKNQNNSTYPHTQDYYKNLFNEGDFNLINIFTNSPLDLFAENAEETWTVFDRPVIRLYEKQK